MKRNIFFAAFLVLTPAAACAQDNGTTGSINPPAAADDALGINAPVAEGNSFTESQVRSKLAEAGYTGIGSLSLDFDGVWRTTAIKGDTLVSLGMDDRGNIVEK